MLRNCLAPTQSMISNLIAVELAHINTNHPDFIGGSQVRIERGEWRRRAGAGRGGRKGGRGEGRRGGKKGEMKGKEKERTARMEI